MYNVFDKNGLKTHVHAHDRNLSVQFKRKITYNVKTVMKYACHKTVDQGT
jgi:hypothetical protein